MEWKKPSGDLVALLDRAMTAFDCERRKMFGCPAYFVRGNMFTGVFADRIFLRLPEAGRAELLAAFDEAEPFEPMPGRVMREYLALPEPSAGDEGVLAHWLERAYRYALELPEKTAKVKKGK